MAKRVVILLFEEILDYCALPEILALSLTSKYLRERGKEYLRKAFTNLLGCWVDDPSEMSKLMIQTGSVLSGSNVLSFISRASHWTAQDMDLYVPTGQPATTMLSFLMREQYKRTTSAPPPNGAYLTIGHNIRHIHKLSKTVLGEDGVTSGTRSIDVVECFSQRSVLPIFCFHSTLVMNWISPTEIVVLYPSLTFNKIGLNHHLCKGTSASMLKKRLWKNKYTSRGYCSAESMAELERPCGTACPSLIRSTRDIGTLYVSLEEGKAAHSPPKVEWALLVGDIKGAAAVVPCGNPRCPRAANFCKLETRQ